MKKCIKCGGNPIFISGIFGTKAKCGKCGAETEYKQVYKEAERAWDEMNTEKVSQEAAPAAPKATKKRAAKKEVE